MTMQKYFIPIVIVTVAILNSTKINAQLSQGGVPVSFALEEKTQLTAVPFEIMPAIDVEVLKAEDVYNDQIKDQPWRFGKDLFVSLNPENSGIWENLANGSRLWRLGITSAGALTINLTFDNYKLPEGATLFIYNSDKSVVMGAFTSLNNQDDRYFAVSPIPGESIIIEYFEPAGVKFPGELNLWRVTHGYRDIAEYEKAFGSSGACNVNAVCPEGDPIRDQIRSVAMIIMGGGLCSGALINNTNNDGTPLFLSANHCYDDPGTVVFRFNWQSATCTNPSSSPSYVSLSGATQRARYTPSDFWLMELNQTPPTEYNVYYSGWNRTSDASIAGTVYGIHHPSGDIKKISWATGGVTTSSYLGNTGSGTDHWRVGSWSDGTTTEGGSSGSPLFDPQYRIIGQLHGGYAACGNTDPDWYGKLGTSWTGDGTDASRLSTWLDPTTTGVITLAGYDPNQSPYTIDGALDEIVAPESYYDDTLRVIPSVIIRNNGTDDLTAADVSYMIDSELPVTFTWTGVLIQDDTDTIEFPEIKLEFGIHNFKTFIDLIGDENVDNDTLELTYHIDTFKIPYGLSAEVIDNNDVVLTWNPKPGDDSEAFVDDFETGDLSLWEEVIDGPGTPGSGTNAHWYVQDGIVYEGSYAAMVDWGYTIDTWIISPSIPASVYTEVSFAWYTSYYWHVDPNDNGDLFVKVSTNGGSTWDEIWTFGNIGVWDNWTWYETVLDLSTYAGQNIQVAFNLVANDNADLNLDIVYIGDAAKKALYGTTQMSNPIAASPDARSVRNLINRNNTLLFQPKSEKVTLVNYSIFRDDIEIGQTTDSTYTDEDLDPDTYTYYVVANYTDPEGSSLPSDEVEVEIMNPFPSPINLFASVSNYNVELIWNEGQESFEDGFESGNLSLWDEVIEGPGVAGEEGYAYWYIFEDGDVAYEGTHSVVINWGYNIDTWIVTPKIIVAENSFLSFYWNSSYYWHVDPNDNGDLFVKVSDDNGATWETLWTFGDIGIWESWTWYETTIDLSDYSGSVLLIAFNLVAENNADVILDNVLIDTSTVKINTNTIRIGGGISADPLAKSIGFIPSLKTSSAPLNKATFSSFGVFRNESEIAQTTDSTYLDEGLALGTYSYYVVANYTDPDGTSLPSNTVLINVMPSAIDPNITGPSVILYPNPSEGIFNISVDREYTVSVMNTNGIRIGEIDIHTNTKSIDLSDYGQGLYILHFRSEDITFVTKVIVQ